MTHDVAAQGSERTGRGERLRVLAVGDSYMPVSVMRSAFTELEQRHAVTYLQLDEGVTLTPATASERRIREYAGTPGQLAERLGSVDVLVVHGAPVTAEALAAGGDLRLVCCARGGPVNVDLEALAERGLPLVSTPGKNAEAVADLTIAFLIMLARRLRTASAFLLDGGRMGASAFEGAEFFGHDLGGHTLGLVGFGQVGSRVAARARSFGLDVAVHDPYVEIGPEHGVEQAELEPLLARADFVSLHARGRSDGAPLFGAREFGLMKRGAWFVNTARESLVDEAALAAALERGHLAGAALDVVEPTDAPGAHPLLRHDNVVMTPHVGGATHETLLRGATMIAEEIERFAADEPLRNALRPETPAAR